MVCSSQGIYLKSGNDLKEIDLNVHVVHRRQNKRVHSNVHQAKRQFVRPKLKFISYRSMSAFRHNTGDTYLFQQQSIVAEDSQWGPGVITRNIKLVPAAKLHGKYVTLRTIYTHTQVKK